MCQPRAGPLPAEKHTSLSGNPLSLTPPLPWSHLCAVKLNANRQVTGVLRGFDQFMNLVLDNAVDEKGKVELGMVVIRGNSIITITALERMDD